MSLLGTKSPEHKTEEASRVPIGPSLREELPAQPASTSPSPLASPQIYADATKRLELYFRPKDPYCHPVCANRFSTNSLLLRIKRKTRRQSGVLGPEARPRVTYDIESLGVVSTVFKFQGNCEMHSSCLGYFRACVPLACGGCVDHLPVKGARLCPGVRVGAEHGPRPGGRLPSLQPAAPYGPWALGRWSSLRNLMFKTILWGQRERSTGLQFSTPSPPSYLETLDRCWSCLLSESFPDHLNPSGPHVL